MKDEQHAGVGRREFVVGATSLALTAGLGGCSESPGGGADGGAADLGAGADLVGSSDASLPTVPAGRVVEVHDPRAVSGSNVDAARVKAMLEAGLKTLAGVETLRQAWRVLLPDFKSSMRLGLKVNTLNSRVPTRPEVAAALVGTLLRDLGAEVGKVAVWDREAWELKDAGFTAQSVGGVSVTSTDKYPGGDGHDPARQRVRDTTTRLSKIITLETDLTINMPVLKTHDIGGISGSIKNVFGCIDNPSDYHGNFNDYVPAVYALSPFPRHFRLTIHDCLYGIVKRFGPLGPPDVLPGRLLLSLDPVAADTHAVALINQLRDPGDPLPSQMLRWLASVEAARLGTSRVQLKKVAI